MAEVTIAQGDVGAHEHELQPGTEDVVRFADYLYTVDIIVSSAEEPVYYTVSGQPARVRGANAYVIPAPGGADSRQVAQPSAVVVRLISAGRAVYSVQASA